MGFTPASRARLKNSMAPKRLPWSVRASAGKPSCFARSTRRRRRATASRRLYSEWTCRWTKSARSVISQPSVPDLPGRGPGREALYSSVTTHSGLRARRHAYDEPDQPGNAGQDREGHAEAREPGAHALG